MYPGRGAQLCAHPCPSYIRDQGTPGARSSEWPQGLCAQPLSVPCSCGRAVVAVPSGSTAALRSAGQQRSQASGRGPALLWDSCPLSAPWAMSGGQDRLRVPCLEIRVSGFPWGPSQPPAQPGPEAQEEVFMGHVWGSHPSSKGELRVGPLHPALEAWGFFS